MRPREIPVLVAEHVPERLRRCVFDEWLSDEEQRSKPSWAFELDLLAWERWREARDRFEAKTGETLPEPADWNGTWAP
jgi:hypothetical protein